MIHALCLSALILGAADSSALADLQRRFDAEHVAVLRAYHAANNDFSKIEKEANAFGANLDRIYVPKALELAAKLPRPEQRRRAMMFALRNSLMLDSDQAKVSSLERTWKFLVDHRAKFGSAAETFREARAIGASDGRIADLAAPIRAGKFGAECREAVLYAEAIAAGGPNAAEDSAKQLKALIAGSPKSRYAGEAKAVLDLRAKLQSGATAPALTFATTSGGKFSTGAERGKVVLIDFWGFWCPGCVQELGELKEIRSRYPASQLSMLSVGTDDWPVAYFAERAREAGLNWTHSLVGGPSSEQITRLGVSVFPAKLILDREGKVVAFGPNFLLGDWRAALESALK